MKHEALWIDWIGYLQAEGGNKVKAVIVGPTSGPPIADDPNTDLYTTLFGRLAAAGVGLVGYIHVSYGQRPVSEVRGSHFARRVITIWVSAAEIFETCHCVHNLLCWTMHGRDCLPTAW